MTHSALVVEAGTPREARQWAAEKWRIPTGEVELTLLARTEEPDGKHLNRFRAGHWPSAARVGREAAIEVYCHLGEVLLAVHPPAAGETPVTASDVEAALAPWPLDRRDEESVKRAASLADGHLYCCGWIRPSSLPDATSPFAVKVNNEALRAWLLRMVGKVPDGSWCNDALQAWLIPWGTSAFQVQSREAVEQELAAVGITHGIDAIVLDEVCRAPHDEAVVVACGLMAEPGLDARVEYLCSNLTATEIPTADASLLGLPPGVVEVAAGQPLARKAPATKGKPGCTVRGEWLAALDGRDAVSLAALAGSGTKASPDGMLVQSTRAGYATLSEAKAQQPTAALGGTPAGAPGKPSAAGTAGKRGADPSPSRHDSAARQSPAELSAERAAGRTAGRADDSASSLAPLARTDESSPILQLTVQDSLTFRRALRKHQDGAFLLRMQRGVLYLLVDGPQQKGPKAIKADDVLRAMALWPVDERDEATTTQVVAQAAWKPTPVGRVILDPLPGKDDLFAVKVDKRKQTAFVLPWAMPLAPPLLGAALKEALAQAGVKYGIDQNALKSLASGSWDKPVAVAKLGTVDFQAASVEEAKAKGSALLGIPPGEVQLTISKTEKVGFLGLGGKLLHVTARAATPSIPKDGRMELRWAGPRLSLAVYAPSGPAGCGRSVELAEVKAMLATLPIGRFDEKRLEEIVKAQEGVLVPLGECQPTTKPGKAAICGAHVSADA
ncbi:MAG: flagellar assembly protein A, partial [Pseudomonadota bacterium]